MISWHTRKANFIFAVWLTLTGFIMPGVSPRAADFATGSRAYENGDYQSALTHWRPLANQGEPRAQYNLGVMYERGHGVEPDPAQAATLWRQAAATGLAWAQHNLGVLLLTRGVDDPEYDDGVRWLIKAGDQNFGPSQYALAEIYAHGQGVERNQVRAIRLYLLAAEQGFVEAQYRLGSIYRDGEGVKTDIPAAIRCLKLAANNGNAGAQNSLGRQFAEGIGIKQNDIQALKWIILSAGQKNSEAIVNRVVMTQRMSSEQIRNAERQAEEWRQKQSATSSES